MVQKAQYMVSEKTDGVRYLMVVVSSGRAVLVDRKLNCFTMEGLDELRNTAELPAGTVLDGEIVQNRFPQLLLQVLLLHVVVLVVVCTYCCNEGTNREGHQ